MKNPAIQALKTAYANQNSPHNFRLKPSPQCDQIVLIRHGKPDLTKSNWSSRKGALNYIADYDRARVFPSESPILCFDEVSLRYVFSSNTPRAVHTAELLVENKINIIADARFREFERKIFWFPNINLYLPLQLWITLSRILWLIGLNSRNIETRTRAYMRAKKNANFLSKDAQQQRVSLLVAHGFHNKVVKDALKKMGWQAVRDGGHGYWAFQILAKPRQ